MEAPNFVSLAPGWPGAAPRWTSSAKKGLGTDIGNKSRVWFTLNQGIFNEIYYPHIDQACVRDLELIVTDGSEFFSEEKRDTDSKIHWLGAGIPAFKLSNTCRENRYRLEKEIVLDPDRDTVMQHVLFIPQKGKLDEYHLYILLAPHLENQGNGNTAWVDSVEGKQFVFAQRANTALALGCSAPLKKRSVGFVGVSDGWQDLQAHKQMNWEYTRAENGNVALSAEINLSKCQGDFVIALGFGSNPQEAAKNVTASLKKGFDKSKREYIAGWQEWIKIHTQRSKGELNELSKKSLSVMRILESKTQLGGVIASLSVPWGESKGDKDIGGYHLMWPRDVVQMAGGFLSVGGKEDVHRMLSFLLATQQPDGHWPQNMWSDGSPYLTGIQLDEAALPILLVDLAIREKVLSKAEEGKFWPMVKQAAKYLMRKGPVSPQDRWEENAGFTPFTVSVEIAAFLAAADQADANHEPAIAVYLRENADVWNASIEQWLYVTGTDLCQQFNVDGYYIRIAPITEKGIPNSHGTVQIKNIPGNASQPAVSLVSTSVVALCRFGLRAPNDKRINDTLKIVDALLKVETPKGSVWHRYNRDSYGEHEDGSAFDGTGIGRGWPLLTGERGHHELAAGRIENAKQLLNDLESIAGENGFIPEQIWDSEDIPEKGLYKGKPTGSAMPLGWAHAEYLKLRQSLIDGKVFDMPAQTVQRYLIDQTDSSYIIWRFNYRIDSMPSGKTLRIETLTPSVIHWSCDQWQTTSSNATRDRGLDIHTADLETADLQKGTQITFTFYWPEANQWEKADFMLQID